MPWYDDSWKDGYDAWKLMSPDQERGYYDGEPGEECDHDDYEADILTGRATCNMCGHSWYQTQDEIEREIAHIREYDEWQREERRREFWRWLTYPIRWPIYRAMNRLWPRQSLAVLSDDEIPF